MPWLGNPIAMTFFVIYVRSRSKPSSLKRSFDFDTNARAAIRKGAGSRQVFGGNLENSFHDEREISHFPFVLLQMSHSSSSGAPVVCPVSRHALSELLEEASANQVAKAGVPGTKVEVRFTTAAPSLSQPTSSPTLRLSAPATPSCGDPVCVCARVCACSCLYAPPSLESRARLAAPGV